MKRRFFIFALMLLPLPLMAQNWSTFLDPTRAIDWTHAGFSIPPYSVNCSTQPSLLAGSGNASANTTAIQNALASCDATHNVVNIPAGTWYVAGITYGSQGFQVLRGAGASSTKIILTTMAGCGGLQHGVCMLAGDLTYSGSGDVLPVSTGGNGSRQCSWSSGYTQGTTTIGLTGCGGLVPSNSPTVGQTIILDQANDTSDTNGVYMCDGATSNCTYEAVRNANGRVISGNLYSTEQVVTVTGLTSLGGSAYTATISPGVANTNIRSGQTPGVWWPGFVQNDGIENMTLDATSITSGTLGMMSCYQCWAKGMTFLNGDRNSVLLYQSSHDVIRDSYFYGALSHDTTSYNIEADSSSDFLVENNIFQQLTTPMVLNGSVTGAVFDYNFSIDNIFADGTWAVGVYASHAAADNMILFEGNVVNSIEADNASGPADQVTNYRNLLSGYQPWTSYPVTFTNGSAVISGTNSLSAGEQVRFSTTGSLPTNFVVGTIYFVNGTGLSPTQFSVCPTIGCSSNITAGSAGSGIQSVLITVVNTTVPTILRSLNRNFNFVGNVLGHPSLHTNYQAYATSTTTFSGAGSEYVSIYDLGGGGTGDVCSLNPGSSTLCDPLTPNTLMRWGNYDVVNAATQWTSAEAATLANTYVSANFTTSYFNTLAHTLPASLYYGSTPPWWPGGKAWPPIGPDVSSGNVGICNGGKYAGWQATTTGQCTGGSLSTAWASHAVSIPAMDCYQNTMGGPPDGSGGTLSFNASTCYAAGATFTLSTATAGSGSGTITGCAGNYAAGASYSCTVTPSPGSIISSVTGCGGSGTTTYAGLMPASNCTVTATFQTSSVATPTFSPPAGTYATPPLITISTTTTGAVIHYTVDGSTPTSSSAVYTHPLYGALSQTLKAYGTAAGFSDSPVGSATYTIGTLGTANSQSTTASSINPSPAPKIVRSCCNNDWNDIEGTRGSYNWTVYDAWKTQAQTLGADFMYTFSRVPGWANGNAGTAVPPTDISVSALCQNVLAGTTTTGCSYKEFMTAKMQHDCGVSSQPVTPLVGVCKVRYTEGWNEFNGDGFWTGTDAQLAIVDNDITRIVKTYCGDCLVAAPSVSAGGDGFHANGQPGIYYTAAEDLLAAWAAIPNAWLPDVATIHEYCCRTDVTPATMPTTLVSNSSSFCTAINTPNVHCRTAIKDQTGVMQGTSVLQNAAIKSWASKLPVYSTEGGWGLIKDLTSTNDKNSIQTSTTTYSITANVATITAANTFTAGETIYLGGWTSATVFNGQTVTVLSSGLSSSSYQFNFTHGNVSTTADITGWAMDAQTSFIRSAWVAQYLAVTAASQTPQVLWYELQNDACWGILKGPGTNAGCNTNPVLPTGNLPWFQAYAQMYTWLSGAVITPGSLTSVVSGGNNIWTLSMTAGGNPVQIVWYDGWLTTTTQSTTFSSQQNLAGIISSTGGNVTLSQQPIYLSNGAVPAAPSISVIFLQ